MKNLSKIMATGIAAQEDFVNNLAELIEQCPRVAELLAEGVWPKMSQQDIELKAKKEYERNNQKVTSIEGPIMTSSLMWEVKVHYSYPRYFKNENHSDYGVNKKDDEHPYEGTSESWSTMNID